MRAIRVLFWLVAGVLAAPGAGGASGLPEPAGELATPEPQDFREEFDQLRARLDRLEAVHARLPRSLHAFPLPARLEFAGEAVPLDRWDVAERLEREFLLSL